MTFIPNIGNGAASALLASGDATAQTASNTSLATTTVPNDAVSHQYIVGGYVTITAVSAATIGLRVDYTDETSAARTQTIFPTGATASAGATGAFNFPMVAIRAKFNTAITLKSILTGVSATYDAGGFIQRVN